MSPLFQASWGSHKTPSRARGWAGSLLVCCSMPPRCSCWVVRLLRCLRRRPPPSSAAAPPFFCRLLAAALFFACSELLRFSVPGHAALRRWRVADADFCAGLLMLRFSVAGSLLMCGPWALLSRRPPRAAPPYTNGGAHGRRRSNQRRPASTSQVTYAKILDVSSGFFPACWNFLL